MYAFCIFRGETPIATIRSDIYRRNTIMKNILYGIAFTLFTLRIIKYTWTVSSELLAYIPKKI